jgi:hypothetical protein
VSAKNDIFLKLALQLRGQPYVLTITPRSFKLALKGKREREAIELPWTAFLDEDAAMLSALHASIRRRLRPRK